MQSNTKLNAKSYHIFTNTRNELVISYIPDDKNKPIIHKNQTTIFTFLKASL